MKSRDPSGGLTLHSRERMALGLIPRADTWWVSHPTCQGTPEGGVERGTRMSTSPWPLFLPRLTYYRESVRANGLARIHA